MKTRTKDLLLSVTASLFFVSCSNEEKDNRPSNRPVLSRDSAAKSIDASINPYAVVDVSPMDMSYYPADYPKIKMTDPNTEPPYARVLYSRPHLQGRKLFPDVLNYGTHWRLGANEATELQLYRDATILGEKVKAGRYVLYCIPQQNTWTVILNSNIDSWGLIPDSTKDLAHFTIPSTTTKQRLEFFTIVFEKSGTSVDLLLAWDNVEARLPLTFQ